MCPNKQVNNYQCQIHSQFIFLKFSPLLFFPQGTLLVYYHFFSAITCVSSAVITFGRFYSKTNLKVLNPSGIFQSVYFILEWYIDRFH